MSERAARMWTARWAEPDMLMRCAAVWASMVALSASIRTEMRSQLPARDWSLLAIRSRSFGAITRRCRRCWRISGVDGILLDLGVSSYQLDNGERGFSYREDAPLDMRMDQRQEKCARDIVNEYSEMELYRMIRDYGEDRFAKNIAKHIVQARAKKPIETTFELSDIIRGAIPAKIRATGGHPAKRTFQAIRIELNRELDVLEQSIDSMIDLLNPGGRLCIITFHSLEDRIVKSRFRINENPCTCPPDFPVCVCGKVSKGKVITRKPILPSAEELERNSRSASAKLRIFEKK